MLYNYPQSDKTQIQNMHKEKYATLFLPINAAAQSWNLVKTQGT